MGTALEEKKSAEESWMYDSDERVCVRVCVCGGQLGRYTGRRSILILMATVLYTR